MLELSQKANFPPLPMNQKEFDQILDDLNLQPKKVLRLFLEGKDDTAIAQALNLALGTVRAHMFTICKSFQLTRDEEGSRMSHREDLIRLFIRYKGDWVSPELRPEVGEPAWEYPNGSVPLNSYFYIPRGNIESRCYQEIKKTGALIRIKAPKLLGKTSLMRRILAEAQKQEEIRTVEVNIAKVDPEILSGLERFLRWFCLFVGKQLKLENQLDQVWESSSGGSIINCSAYFEEFLLPAIDCPLVLALDEVDRIFPYSFAPEFFSLLRTSFHEEAKTKPIFENLRLCLSHSTEVYIQIKATESPFNVGIPIELPEFTLEEVNTLAIRHNLRWGNAQIEDLMYMVGGHPYLLRLAMYVLATEEISLKQLLQKASTNEGIYSNHLLSLWEHLRHNPELAEAYKTAIVHSNCVELDPMQTRLLSSMGLVKKQDNGVMPRNNLYTQYFRHVL
jgi:hypothetical protein